MGWGGRELGGGLLLAGALLLGGCGAPEPRAPNAVLVVLDTLRWDAVGAYGGPVATPVLDGLAAGGVRAVAAIAPSAETAPSHATLLTGRGVERHAVTRNGAPLDGSLPTLAEAFRASGYGTAAFVSSFVLDPRFGWSRGFDHYDAAFSEAGATLEKQRAYPGAFWRGHEFGGFDRRAEATTDAALAWLARAREPFFLFVHYFDPHMPYVPPPALLERTRGLRLAPEGRSVPGVPHASLEELVQRYQAEVLYADRELGRLRDALHAGGRERRTLLLVTADHGEGLGQHGWVEHGVHLYEELVRVPAILHGPAVLPAGGRLETPVGLVDLAATLAELAGVPFDAGPDGRSLAAALRSGQEPEPRPVLGHTRGYAGLPRGAGAAKRSVRTDRWKYIRPEGHPEELYDLAADPGERRDVSREHEDVRARLSALLDAHLAAAPAPRPEPELSDEARRGLEALGYVD